MKKSLLCIFSCFLCTLAFAQLKLETKSFRMADFQERVTKVVLTGQDALDAAIRKAMLTSWYLSPYESCTKEEFEKIKHSNEYYFLVVGAMETAVPDINMIYLFKGNNSRAKKYDGMFNIIALPFSGTGHIRQSELALLPVLLTAIQGNVSKMMGKTFNLSPTVKRYIPDINSRKGQKIIMEKNDLPEEFRTESPGLENFVAGDEKLVAECISKREPGTFAGLCITPGTIRKDSRYFTLIIDACTWELTYLMQHRIDDAGQRPCFSRNELERFLEDRKEK